jgi:hypothetical protein
MLNPPWRHDTTPQSGQQLLFSSVTGSPFRCGS